MGLFSAFMLILLLMKSEKVNSALKIIQHAAGNMHNCVLFNDHTAKCWGRLLGFGYSNHGDFGTLKQDLGDHLPFLNPGTGYSITKLGCGGDHTCMILHDASLKCFGDNRQGQIGLEVKAAWIVQTFGYFGDTLPFVNLGTGIKALDIALGYYHTCVKVTGNKVKCFGNGLGGKLGYPSLKQIGSYPGQMGDNLTFVDLGKDVQVRSIHSGSLAKSTCAILSAPTAYEQRMKCWGLNNYSQLGYGDTGNYGDELSEMGDNIPLVDLGIESRVKQVAITESSTCALLINNNVKCWGIQLHGQFGLGSKTPIYATGNLIPIVPIDSDKVVKQMDISASHSCFLFDDNITVKCVGSNYYGELGQEDQIQRGGSPGSLLPNISSIKLGLGTLPIQSVRLNAKGTCVTFSDNLIKCFGYNSRFGVLGIGSKNYVGMFAGDMGMNLKPVLLFNSLFSYSDSQPKWNTTTPTHSATRRPKYISTKLPSRPPFYMKSHTPSTLPTLFQNILSSPSPSKTSKQPSPGAVVLKLKLSRKAFEVISLIVFIFIVLLVVILSKRCKKNKNSAYIPYARAVRVMTRDNTSINPVHGAIDRHPSTLPHSTIAFYDADELDNIPLAVAMDQESDGE